MSDGQRPRVYAWLKRHQARELELTPLVEARIAARHRSERIERAGYVLAIVAFLVMGMWHGITGRGRRALPVPDDRLRTVDVDRALTPYPVVLAIVAMVGSEESVQMWGLLGYVVAASVVWLVPWLPQVWGAVPPGARP